MTREYRRTVPMSGRQCRNCGKPLEAFAARWTRLCSDCRRAGAWGAGVLGVPLGAIVIELIRLAIAVVR